MFQKTDGLEGNIFVNLRLPGPVPLPPTVRDACALQMINPRSSEFHSLLEEVNAGLKKVFQTENDVLIFAASGTGCLEAVIANLVSYGDNVLAISCGRFGERWAEIANAFGAKVTHLQFPAGQPIDPEIVLNHARFEKKYRLILATHNETSTGVVNNIKTLADGLKLFGAGRPLLAIDAISSLGAINLPVDELELDVVVAASQKAFMAPPGLAFVSVSPRAWEETARTHSPRYYWDFRRARNCLTLYETPFTPAITLLFALRCSLQLMLQEGLIKIFERHKQMGQRVRSGFNALGLELFANDAYASDTVTAIRIPMGWNENELISSLRLTYNVHVGGGMGYPIFRVGHMGYVAQEELDAVINCMKSMLCNRR